MKRSVYKASAIQISGLDILKGRTRTLFFKELKLPFRTNIAQFNLILLPVEPYNYIS